MASDAHDQQEDLAAAARAFSRLGYVHAFGHVSMRLKSSLLITPTRPPLAAQRAEDLIAVDFAGRVAAGDSAALPIEVFLHIGIYQARDDVQAICRTHAPYASVWPANGRAPAIQHGFGGIVGTVAMFDEYDLIHNPELGARAARALGGAQGMMLRGNGVLTVGRTLSEAAARMWSLEERCAQAARQTAPQTESAASFSAGDLAARQRWYSAEAERIWTWLKYLGTSTSAGG